MCDFRIYSRDFIFEFIEEYRINECLWNTTHPDYKNRNIKLSSMNKLLNLVQKVEPEANLDSVKKKINSLRASYRKERKKVRDSHQSGCSTDETYQPKLWYYQYLQFLDDQEKSQIHFVCLQSMSNTEENETVTSIGPEDDESRGSSPSDYVSNVPRENFNISSPSTSAWQPHRDRFKRENTNDDIQKVFGIIGEKYWKLSKPEDEFDIVGKNVANKLRNMTAFQRTVAEKLINDVLFEGAMNNLQTCTTITTPLINKKKTVVQ